MLSRRRWLAGLLVLGLLAGQAAVWDLAAHIGRNDDAACADTAATVGEHHRGGPQVEQPIAAGPSDHCTFCHLHRAFASVRLERIGTAVPAFACLGFVERADARRASPAATHADLRGPPSLN